MTSDRQIDIKAPDVILQFDAEGTISYLNRPPPGHTVAALLGTNVRQWMEPRFHEAFGRALAEALGSGGPSSYESVGSVTGRSYIHRISAVREPGAAPTAVLIAHDITDKLRADELAVAAERRYRALVEASFEGLAISIEGRVVDVNDAAARLFGYAREELIGKWARQLATAESAERIARQIAAIREEKTAAP